MELSSTLPPSMRLTHLWPIRDRVEHLQRQRAKAPQSNPNSNVWPAVYIHLATGKLYRPHNAEEAEFVYTDGPRYFLCKGGEGSGKSTAGIIKVLERLRRGMSGIMGSSDLQHFKISLWKEFRRWCPREVVIASQRYRLNPEWEPSEKFTLNFVNGTELICGGFNETQLGNWEGPNVNFVYFDEAWKHETGKALKLFAGRIRIPGPKGEPPQMWLTSIPWMHWLYEYFGPVKDQDEQVARFKQSARTITLATGENAENLDPNYIEERTSVLTEAEIRVRMNAEWEAIDDSTRFLPSIHLWDACIDTSLPPLDTRTPLVLAVDAGVSNDNFALIGVSRHPERPQDVALRLSRVWEPKGKQLDFTEIEREITEICKAFHIVCVVYDKYQLHQMMGNLANLVWTDEFSQQAARLVADKQLLDLISQAHLWHDGTHDMVRKHLDNANRKLTDNDKLRLVKRTDQGKIDLAVALSMAAAKCLELNLG